MLIRSWFSDKLEHKIAKCLMETQARLFISWLEHQVLKTVGKVVAMPVALPFGSAKWMLDKIHEQVEAEQTDEERVKSRLMELQLRHEIGEIEEQEYLEQEKVLMEDLAAIREWMKDQQYEPDEAWWRRTFPEGFAQEQE